MSQATMPQQYQSTPPIPPQQPVVRKNGLGITALVLGLVAVPLAIIPFVGPFVGIPLGALALIFAIVGLVLALRGRAGKPLPIIGALLGILAMSIGIAQGVSLNNAFDDPAGNDTVVTAPEVPGAEDRGSQDQPAETQMTTSQEQAVRAAESYIDTMPFSKRGLIDQLVYDQHSEADATFAVNHIDVDWNEQAVKAAQGYLDIMPFSQGDLVDQLKHDGFTQAQAEHGAEVVFQN